MYWDNRFSPYARQFAAVGCVVVEGPLADASGVIECHTVPGYGLTSAWQLTVSGLTTTYFFPEDASLHYAYPTITSFEGVGAADAETGGQQVVRIVGSHFSTATLNALTGITYGPDATNATKYTPSDCRVVEDHSVLECSTVPGVGGELMWSISVGNQTAATRVTSYGPPFISSITGPGSADMDTRGGQLVVLTGENFGTVAESVAQPSSIDYVEYGSATYPPVSYRAANCVVVVDNTVIHCTTIPGVGTNLSWVVSIAGQESEPYSVLISYAKPVITKAYVVSDATKGAPSLPSDGAVQVALEGANFGRIGDITIIYNGLPSTAVMYFNHTYLQVHCAGGVAVVFA